LDMKLNLRAPCPRTARTPVEAIQLLDIDREKRATPSATLLIR